MPLFHKSSVPYISLTIAIAIWGIATPVIKYTVGYVPPLTFLMIRFLLAAIILLPFTIHTLKTTKINLFRYKHLIIMAVLGNVVTLSLIFIALSKTTAIEGAVITSLMPLMATLMAAIFLHEAIKRHEIEGLLIALVGTLVIIFEPLVTETSITNPEELSFIGNLIFLSAVLFDAGATIYLKKWISNDKLITPFKYIAITYSITAIIMIPLGLAEQYKLYLETTDINAEIRFCKVSDYDLGNYLQNAKCDETGCYKTTPQREYFCLNQKPKVAYVSYLAENLKNYSSMPSLMGILYMALISGIVAYTLYAIGLKYLSASETTIFYYMQPLFGIPISIMFLHEQVGLLFLVGAGLIIFGIIKAERKDARNMLKS